MDDPQLRKPPPHLEGALLLQDSKKFGKKVWKEKHVLVLKDTFLIYKTKKDKDAELKNFSFNKETKEKKSIPLIQVEISESIATHVPEGHSVNWAFQLKLDQEEFIFLAPSFEDQSHWVKGLQYVQKFWMRKQEAEMMEGKLKQSELENDKSSNPNRENEINGDFFTTTVTSFDGKPHIVQLSKDAKFSELYRAVNGDGPCANCPMCLIKEKAAQLWALGRNGTEFMVRKLERIFPRFEEGCEFFLLEHGYKLLMVQFPDNKYLAQPVEPTVKAGQVSEIDKFDQKLKRIGCSNVGLFLLTPAGEELPFREDEKPLEVFYRKQDGIWKRNTEAEGTLVLRNKSLKVPCKSIELDDNVIHSGRARVRKIDMDETQKQVSKVLERLRKKQADRPENQMEFSDDHFNSDLDSDRMRSKSYPPENDPQDKENNISKSAPGTSRIGPEPDDLNPVFLSSSLTDRYMRNNSYNAQPPGKNMMGEQTRTNRKIPADQPASKDTNTDTKQDPTSEQSFAPRKSFVFDELRAPKRSYSSRRVKSPIRDLFAGLVSEPSDFDLHENEDETGSKDATGRPVHEERPEGFDKQGVEVVSDEIKPLQIPTVECVPEGSESKTDSILSREPENGFDIGLENQEPGISESAGTTNAERQALGESGTESNYVTTQLKLDTEVNVEVLKSDFQELDPNERALSHDIKKLCAVVSDDRDLETGVSKSCDEAEVKSKQNLPENQEGNVKEKVNYFSTSTAEELDGYLDDNNLYEKDNTEDNIGDNTAEKYQFEWENSEQLLQYLDENIKLESVVDDNEKSITDIDIDQVVDDIALEDNIAHGKGDIYVETEKIVGDNAIFDICDNKDIFVIDKVNISGNAASERKVSDDIAVTEEDKVAIEIDKGNIPDNTVVPKTQTLDIIAATVGDKGVIDIDKDNIVGDIETSDTIISDDIAATEKDRNTISSVEANIGNKLSLLDDKSAERRNTLSDIDTTITEKTDNNGISNEDITPEGEDGKTVTENNTIRGKENICDDYDAPDGNPANISQVKVNTDLHSTHRIQTNSDHIGVVLPRGPSVANRMSSSEKEDFRVSDFSDSEASSDSDSEASSIEGFMESLNGNLPKENKKSGGDSLGSISNQDGSDKDSPNDNATDSITSQDENCDTKSGGKHIGIIPRSSVIGAREFERRQMRSSPGIVMPKSNAHNIGKANEVLADERGYPILKPKGKSPEVKSERELPEVQNERGITRGKYKSRNSNETSSKDIQGVESERGFPDETSSDLYGKAGASMKHKRRRNAFREGSLYKEAKQDRLKHLISEKENRSKQEIAEVCDSETSILGQDESKPECQAKPEHLANPNNHAITLPRKLPSHMGKIEAQTQNKSTTLPRSFPSRGIKEVDLMESPPIAIPGSLPLHEHESDFLSPSLKLNRISPSVSSRGASSCMACMDIDERPFAVNTYKLIGLVIKQCRKPGAVGSGPNQYDYICLSGVHLRNDEGLWELSDNTSFHSNSELTDSLELMKSRTSSTTSADAIASKIVREKQVMLGNGICCHWIPQKNGPRGKWRVIKTEQNYAAKANDEYEQDLIPRPISTPVPFVNKTAGHEDVPRDTRGLQDALDQRDNRTMTSSFMGLKTRMTSKVKDAFAQVTSGNSSRSSSRASSPEPTAVYMSPEVIVLREQVLVPINRAVNQIRQHFYTPPQHDTGDATHKHHLGDDTAMPQIGWLIRRDLCSAIAGLLLLGMKSDTMLPQFLFGKITKFNLWSLIKDVSRACVEEPVVGSMVQIIQDSPFLFDDDLRFRCFVCETLNCPNEAGKEKLFMTWFRKFLMVRPILEKFYKPGSFWRMTNQAETHFLVEEIILIFSHLNEYTFNLRCDFEYRELRRNKEEQNKNADFVLQRQQQPVDVAVCTFE